MTTWRKNFLLYPVSCPAPLFRITPLFLPLTPAIKCTKREMFDNIRVRISDFRRVRGYKGAQIYSLILCFSSAKRSYSNVATVAPNLGPTFMRLTAVSARARPLNDSIVNPQSYRRDRGLLVSWRANLPASTWRNAALRRCRASSQPQLHIQREHKKKHSKQSSLFT